MQYNTTYHWRVKVTNDLNNQSDWFSGPDYRFDGHAAPYPDFSVAPLSPNIGQDVNFTDSSICFNSDGSSYVCSTDINTTYSWDFGDNSVIDTTKGNTSHTYVNSASYTPNLNVCDGTVCCQIDKNITVKRSLQPFFKEISPF